jgi:hypothetical protein
MSALPLAVALALLLAGCCGSRPAAVRLAVMECVATMEPSTPDDWRAALEGCTL